MGAGVADGIAGPVNVEERNPLVSGVDQLGLPGLQVIGVRDCDIRRHEVLLGQFVGSMLLAWLHCVVTSQSCIRSGSQKR